MKTFLRAAFALLLLTPPLLYAQNTGTFTLSTAINTDGTLTPTLTWATTPAATGCTASGDTAWTGNKSASGTQTLAAFPATSPRLYLLICTWPGDTQAMLSWTPPSTFEPYDHDGNPNTPPIADPLPVCPSATDTGACLAKYRVHHGVASGQLTEPRDVNSPTATSMTWGSLSVGPHFFAIQAITGQGAVSRLSGESSKAITGPVQWSQATGVRRPAAPTMTP